MRRTYFWSGTIPDRPSSGHVTLSLPAKSPIGVDMEHLLVAHAHNILPDMVTSGHVTSGSTTSNDNLSVPIYYSYNIESSTILMIDRQEFLKLFQNLPFVFKISVNMHQSKGR